MTDDSCLFCRIIAGEIPAEMVARDDHHVAFRDINPAAPTHLLVVPRDHHVDLDAFVADGGDASRTLAFISSTADQLGLRGAYRLQVNVGAAAGQEVFHLHWHLLSSRNTS